MSRLRRIGESHSSTSSTPAPPPYHPSANAPQVTEAPTKKRRGCLFWFLVVLVGTILAGVVGYHVLKTKVVQYCEQMVDKSPLYVAAAAGNVSEVDRFISEGADVNVQAMMGHTPLIEATALHHSQVVQKLLDAGANPNCHDKLGWTPLHHAVRTDAADLDMIALLVQHGADVNGRDKRKRTPLHRAAQFGHVGAVSLLLKLGADPNARDYNDWTPLDRGAAHPAISDILLPITKQITSNENNDN